MSQFYKIKISDIKKETTDTVSIAFNIPENLKNEFQFQSGQYVTVRATIKGEDIRRSYSICSAPYENEIRIGVKKIENGKMSSFLTQELHINDELEVMPPSGNFIVKNLKANVVGFAAGSGITPLLSIIKSVLKSGGKFTLFYGNKTAVCTIFKKELDKLVVDYPNQLVLHYIFSKEESSKALYHGRINEEKVTAFIKENLELLKADGFYLCGPEEMINAVNNTLKYVGVSEEKIHFELFTTPVKANNLAADTPNETGFKGISQVKVIMDGEEFEFELKNDGEAILDAAMNQGVDAPFSCKGAVCCTCKAQIIEGKATMEMNYALSDQEVADGFILTCQAHPASEKLVVDYDVI
ncbi:MAG: 2Fe-2S iron-sulfur cluster binding domain-containing protein [Vicingaceae bacterium]|nr:2Fe-2S iron-sulfur cluster binding domain-containing protein [Vicingaceae bacterium]